MARRAGCDRRNRSRHNDREKPVAAFAHDLGAERENPTRAFHRYRFATTTTPTLERLPERRLQAAPQWRTRAQFRACWSSCGAEKMRSRAAISAAAAIRGRYRRQFSRVAETGA